MACKISCLLFVRATGTDLQHDLQHELQHDLRKLKNHSLFELYVQSIIGATASILSLSDTGLRRIWRALPRLWVAEAERGTKTFDRMRRERAGDRFALSNGDGVHRQNSVPQTPPRQTYFISR